MVPDVRSLVTVSRVVVTFLIVQALWTVVRIPPAPPRPDLPSGEPGEPN
jgi:hypothetical protein